jgi:very-short-patch-repair endonuclease
VSRAELLAMGVAAPAVDYWVRTRRLQVVHRGVYAVGHARLRVEGRRLAAVLACGPGAVLSHRSAAAHWGLLTTAQERFDVTAPRSGSRNQPGIRAHSSRSLDAQDTTNHQGIPTTSVSRTLLDLAATCRATDLERALANAQRARVYDHGAIESVLARSNGHRGRATLRRAVAREPKLTRSEFEAELLALLRDHRLPEPLVNEPYYHPDVGEIVPDFRWPHHRLIGETDGWESHRTRAAFESDPARDAALTAAGHRVMRFTYEVEPATVLRRVRALLHD